MVNSLEISARTHLQVECSVRLVRVIDEQRLCFMNMWFFMVAKQSQLGLPLQRALNK